MKTLWTLPGISPELKLTKTFIGELLEGRTKMIVCQPSESQHERLYLGVLLLNFHWSRTRSLFKKPDTLKHREANEIFLLTKN